MTKLPVETPVYMFLGFLESGKTKFIQETFEDPRFSSGEKTLLLVCEEGEEDAYLSSIEMVKEVLLAEAQFLTLLASPSISLQERLTVIDEAFGGKVPDHLLSYLKLLCEKGRIPCC